MCPLYLPRLATSLLHLSTCLCRLRVRIGSYGSVSVYLELITADSLYGIHQALCHVSDVSSLHLGVNCCFCRIGVGHSDQRNWTQ